MPWLHTCFKYTKYTVFDQTVHVNAAVSHRFTIDVHPAWSQIPPSLRDSMQAQHVCTLCSDRCHLLQLQVATDRRPGLFRIASVTPTQQHMFKTLQKPHQRADQTNAVLFNMRSVAACNLKYPDLRLGLDHLAFATVALAFNVCKSFFDSIAGRGERVADCDYVAHQPAIAESHR